MLLIYRELNILCVKYSLYSPYDDDVIIQDGASNNCPDYTTNVPIENMTDTLVLAPKPFSGSAVQDAAEWLRQFTNYCAYKNFTDHQARNLFRVMLTVLLRMGLKPLFLTRTVLPLTTLRRHMRPFE